MPKTFAELLQERLEITQVKPSQLAKKMKVKSNSVYRWLAGNPIRQGEEYREKLLNCINLLGFYADKNGIKLFNEFLQAAGQSILIEKEQFFPNPSQSSQLSPNISDLPNPNTPLVGRTKELKTLNETLYNREINVVGIIAAGGIGKSALTHEWLEQLETRNYGNIQYVFIWSFYNQANSEIQTSSTLFFEKALPYFGHQGDLPKTDNDKADCLAILLREKPCLLILDGVEPLQHNLENNQGKFRDMSMGRLLRHIGKHELNGLIVVSSRQTILELENQKHYQEIKLQTLTKTDGTKLLRQLQAKDSIPELKTVVKEWGGHALALVLLANLGKTLGKKLTSLQISPFADKKQGGHAKRVMQFYDEYWSDDKPEKLFLFMLGLFDRPMSDIKVLLDKIKIFQPLAKLSDIEYDWLFMENNLRELGLLLETKDKKWDIHPLIREYFGEQFKTKYPIEWQTSHRVLFKYFQTFDKNALRRAVHHGCLAENYSEALQTFRENILEEHKSDSTFGRKGTYSSDLATLSAFFQKKWTQPIDVDLTDDEQKWLLKTASFFLVLSGQLEASQAANDKILPIYKKQGDWENVILLLRDSIVTDIALGNLATAKLKAQETVKLTQYINDDIAKTIGYTTLFGLQFCKEEFAESLAGFEKITPSPNNPSYPIISLISGIWYYPLLLNMARNESDLQHIAENCKVLLDIAVQSQSYMHSAFIRMTLARSMVMLGKSDAEHEFNKAVADIHKEGNILLTPPVELARIEFYRQHGDIKQAQEKLEQLLDNTILPCNMHLWEADARLLEANLYLDAKSNNYFTKAQTAYKRTEKLINTSKYGLRITELSLLAARLYSKDLVIKNKYLKVAEQRIKEIGQWGLQEELNKIRN